MRTEDIALLLKKITVGAIVTAVPLGIIASLLWLTRTFLAARP